MFKFISALLLFVNVTANEILTPEEVFIPQITVKDNILTVDFEIKNGYYLYQDKINITTLDDSKIGELEFSEAEVTEDEFFGETRIYRNSAKITAPITHSSNTVIIEIGLQGCADIGVCFVPSKQKYTVITVNTPEPEQNISNTANEQNFFDSIIEETEQNEPVTPDIAFAFSYSQIDENNLRVSWDIRDGYYLYADKFSFEISGADLGEIELPVGTLIEDDFFGNVEVYYNNLIVDIPLLNITDDISINVNFQGCWKGGVCYPLTQKNIFISNGVAQDNQIIEAIATNIKESKINLTTEISEQDRVVGILEDNNILLIALAFFGFGLALAFTPCVLPMIPILSSIIIGQKDITKGRAFLLSLVFVLAMAFTYTIAGVLAGLFGENLQIILQHPYAIISFSLVFVILAISMFGYFEIKLPNSLNNYFTKISNNQKSGTIIGVIFMGVLSALIVGPCVAPPLAASLIYIGQTGDALLGGISLFALSIGMGIPLIIVGSGVGSLPKTGEWMDNVKHIFGFILLGMAIYLLERIIDPYYILIMWALLLIIAPIVLGAAIKLDFSSSIIIRVYKSFLLLILIYGVLLMLLVARGGLSSGGSFTAPLKGILSNNNAQQQTIELEFKIVKDLADFNNELNTDKIVMLDYYADWCVYCKEYEKVIFKNPDIASKLSTFKLLKADITNNTKENKELMAEFDVFAPPVMLFFKDGKELRSKRIVGELSIKEFLSHINTIQ